VPFVSCANGAPHTSLGQRPRGSGPLGSALKGHRIVCPQATSDVRAYAEPLQGTAKRTSIPRASLRCALGWYAAAPSALRTALLSVENTYSSVAAFVGDGVGRHFALTFERMASPVVDPRLNRLYPIQIAMERMQVKQVGRRVGSRQLSGIPVLMRSPHKHGAKVG